MVGKELLHLENTLCESAASITLLNRWILSLADLLIFNDNDDCKDWFYGDFARFAIVKMMIVFVDNDDRDDVGLDEGIEVEKLMNQMQTINSEIKACFLQHLLLRYLFCVKL